MANFDDYYQLVLTEEFKNWFWFGQNGNTLIKYLNSDRGRQATSSPGLSLKKWVGPHPFFEGKALGTRLTSTHSEFETNFRKRWGMPVSNEFALSYNLPFHTEWVLTTQSFIAYMLQVIQAASQGGRIDASIFKGITFDSGSNLPPGFLQYRRN